MNAKLVLLAGAMVLALLLGSAEIATAQVDGPRIGFIPMPGVGDPSFDSVETGAMVGVRGRWNEDGTLQAAGVAVLGGRQVRDGTGW